MLYPKVALKKVEDIDSYEAIRQTTDDVLNSLSDGLTIPKKATVLIKVNLCLLMGPETGATVDVRVAKALIEWLHANHETKHIIIAEADATHLSADMAFKALGWKDYFAQSNFDIEFCNLSNDKLVEVKTCLGRTVRMSEKYMTADVLISLAKLKTHSLQKITCNMKNLFGACPEKFKIKYHSRLSEAICEFSSTRLPDISMVDGLIAMDGKGPVNGFPRLCKLLIAGTDILATDHFCAKLMGFSPSRIPHISKAIKLGLGNTKYSVVRNGPKIDNLHFRVMPIWEEMFRAIIKGVRERKSAHDTDGSGLISSEF
jgi:uncharacterized protein (DUF362 family)